MEIECKNRLKIRIFWSFVYNQTDRQKDKCHIISLEEVITAGQIRKSGRSKGFCDAPCKHVFHILHRCRTQSSSRAHSTLPTHTGGGSVARANGASGVVQGCDGVTRASQRF